jgi:hypothetical protein
MPEGWPHLRAKDAGTTQWYAQFLRRPLPPMPPYPEGTGPAGGQTKEQMDWWEEVHWRRGDLAVAFRYVFPNHFRKNKWLARRFRWVDADGGRVGFFSEGAYIDWYLGLNPGLLDDGPANNRLHPFVHDFICPFRVAEQDAEEAWRAGRVTDAEFTQRMEDLRDGADGELLFEK